MLCLILTGAPCHTSLMNIWPPPSPALVANRVCQLKFFKQDGPAPEKVKGLRSVSHWSRSMSPISGSSCHFLEQINRYYVLFVAVSLGSVSYHLRFCQDDFGILQRFVTGTSCTLKTHPMLDGFFVLWGSCISQV